MAAFTTGSNSVPNWAYALSEQARTVWDGLDPWLQEEVLDELEVVSANVGRLRRGGHLADAIHDMARDREDSRHYVFLRVELEPSSRTVKVVDIVHHLRPLK